MYGHKTISHKKLEIFQSPVSHLSIKCTRPVFLYKQTKNIVNKSAEVKKRLLKVHRRPVEDIIG